MACGVAGVSLSLPSLSRVRGASRKKIGKKNTRRYAYEAVSMQSSAEVRGEERCRCRASGGPPESSRSSPLPNFLGSCLTWCLQNGAVSTEELFETREPKLPHASVGRGRGKRIRKRQLLLLLSKYMYVAPRFPKRKNHTDCSMVQWKLVSAIWVLTSSAPRKTRGTTRSNGG